MKPLVRAILPLALGLGLAACSGISYNHDFDPQTDFAAFETYVWAQPSPDAGQNPRGVSELVERRVIAALDEQLAAKGYRKIERGQPDFVVNFIVTTQQKVDYTTYYTGWGYYGGWYGGMSTAQTQAREWTEGTMIVDLFDADDKSLVWRGWAQGTIEPNLPPEERNRRINNVVSKLMEKFPPGS